MGCVLGGLSAEGMGRSEMLIDLVDIVLAVVVGLAGVIIEFVLFRPGFA